MQKRFTTITWLLLGIVSLFIAACKPIAPLASPQAQPATTVASIITRESGATVQQYNFDDVTIHAYTSPVAVGSSGTYIIESANTLVLIDAQWMAPFALDFRAYADTLGKPIDRVVITHAHLDHYFGLTAGFPDVDAYALAATQQAIAEQAPNFYKLRQELFGYSAYPAVVIPQMVIDEGSLEIDGVRYEISRVVGAESDEEIVIDLPDLNTLIVGDLVYNGVHLFLGRRDQSAWIAALAEIEAIAPTLILSGHGAPGGVETATFSREYLETATELLATATDGDAYKSAIMAAYPDLGGEFFFDIFLPLLFPEAEEATSAEANMDGAYDGPVTEIAIRRLPDGQDVAVFATARDAFIKLLTAEPGVGVDREFEAIIDGATFGPPTAPLFTGMTQYENLAAFTAAGEKLGSTPEAAAFFATFEPQLFTVLRPKDPTANYDLSAILSEPGQILEVAARDLSKYENFDAADYETRLNAFLATLAKQPGFVAEYQWVSVLDPNLVVGMTVYESVEAFGAIAQDQAFVEQFMPFINDYPPFTGFVHMDARRTTVPGEATDGPIMDLVVRTVPDEAVWWEALGGLYGLLADEPGIEPSREFKSIFSAAPVDPATGNGVQQVYFGLGQIESPAVYNAMISKYMAAMPPELPAYFATNSTLLNIQVQPFRDTPPLDVANMVQPGQVLEIAIRDVSGYESFEVFDSVRKPFVDLLLAQPGARQEFEYRSLDGRYYVGMTLYENVEAFQAILANPAVIGGPEMMAAMSYPPLFSQIGVPMPPVE